MSKLNYRTIANEHPQGKPNVYFSCHPDDFGKYFEEYATKILRIQDCAIWYESEPEADYDREDLELRLTQMQLFVMPVTTKLLTAPCRAIEVELPLAKEKHIPVLPLMMEQGLDDVFARYFGDLQYLDPNNKDETKRKFDEVLETYIRSVLVSSELAEKVRAAFDAYIFLSYRKKDRRKAQELMRLIHRTPLCRDIAIWYDEFLTPGEDFNHAIEKMLEKSDLFALVVTPNLVNEINYVMTTEYPEALEQGKPVLPVEMEKTDRGKLDEHYKSLPPCVPVEESEAFSAALMEKVKTMSTEASDEDPEHNFLIGLAYLDGIDVEVDADRALELIKGAADAGGPEAMEQLVTMYETGKGVTRDYYEGVIWREKHVEYLRKAYEVETTESRVCNLISRLWDLGDAYRDLMHLDKAEAAYGEMCLLSEKHAKSGHYQFRRYLYIGYRELGVTARLRADFERAWKYFEKGLVIHEELTEKANTLESRVDLANSYGEIGDMAIARGDFEGAQNYYKKMFAIREEQAKKVGSIVARRALAICYIRLGELEMKRLEIEEARRYFEKSLAIDEELLEKTGMIDIKLDISIVYDYLGRIAIELGDIKGAQRCYEIALASIEYLSEKTAMISHRVRLTTCCAWLGQIAMEKGDLEEAKRYFEKSLLIFKEIAEKTKTVVAKHGMASNYVTLGNVLSAMGNLEEAKRCYDKSFTIIKELSEKIVNCELAVCLASIYYGLGDIAKKRGDYEEAKRQYEKSLATFEGMMENCAMHEVNIKKGLSEVYKTLGDVAVERGNLEEAQEYYWKNLDVIEELVKKIGTTPVLRDLATALFNLGVFHHSHLISNERTKELFERVVELGKNSSDEHLNGLAKKAQDILDKQF